MGMEKQKVKGCKGFKHNVSRETFSEGRFLNESEVQVNPKIDRTYTVEGRTLPKVASGLVPDG